MTAFNDIRSQTSHLSFAMQMKEKGKVLSQLEMSNSGKIKSINAIIFLINNDISEISAAIS